MAKTVGRACAQIAILLIICGSIQCVKSISPVAYETANSNFAHIYPEEIVSLSPEQLARQRRALPSDVTAGSLGNIEAADNDVNELHRRRRAAPVDSTPAGGSTQDVKTQYQSVSANATVSGNGSGSATVAVGAGTGNSGDAKSAATGSIAYNVHNVGVNGTGQRKDLASNSDTASNYSNATTSINVAASPSTPPKKTQLSASQPSQYPKKVSSQSIQATSTTTDRALIDDVDVSDEVITKEAAGNQLTRYEDHYDYYSSVLFVSKAETSAIWSQFRNIPENTMLSSSHRRAMTVELKFKFPFYGHYVRNITVATGGFLYTGEYVHSWLAATQYIAPLMANFDTSMSEDSFVRLQDNGTAFTVVWENVTLQDKPNYGNFTFSATLHETGDIVFVYYQVPTLINNIQDNQHPVKVGLSDAYIVDKQLYFARRKTIYEYHRVTFSQQEITNNTIVLLKALPTCLGYSDCQGCINHNTTFECAWCPTLNRCSTSNGNDRRKQEWQQKGCDRSMINKVDACPALGQRGNNAAQENSNSNSSNPGGTGLASTTPATNAAGGSTAVTESTISSTQQPANGESVRTPAGASDKASQREMSEHLGAALPENKNVGVAVGFMVPICLVFAVTLWLFYAYRNPHTRSGQLLIQFRPSQWSWRRGEARYTAATIHM